MKIMPLGFSLSRRNGRDLEKMKNYNLVSSIEEYVLFRNNNKYIFLDSAKLELYTVSTKWNLLDKLRLGDMIKLYEFFYYQ